MNKIKFLAFLLPGLFLISPAAQARHHYNSMLNSGVLGNTLMTNGLSTGYIRRHHRHHH